MSENKEGGFTAPTSSSNGAADVSKNTGIVTKDKVTVAAKESSDKQLKGKEMVQVVAVAKAWYKNTRVEPGKKLMVPKALADKASWVKVLK